METEVSKHKTNTKAVISLVVGVVSIVLVYFPMFGFPLSITGIVLGILALREIKQTQEPGRGVAISGLICSILGFVVAILFTLTVVYIFLELSANPL
ncbi:DUF4190 domain-containing protein [Texcoconibacillus texcoconensis]|uniref:DUF4190 domain-containing protein n=1 Tax=Texcoconibacillus texcoconensis TaxID=1095777 RepID=A0A840QKQ6_9BACI|nr:DUF4190 domain-containing protein [Texcoconibacillus texcoconensis]MBB5171953.1 hypothetical protein [Texcoconibacillus texcoconensis]